MFGRTRILGTTVMVMATLMLAAPAANAVTAAAMPTMGGSWSHLPALPDGVTILTAAGAEDNNLYVFGFCEVGPCAQTGGNVATGSPVTYRFNNGAWQPRRHAPAICADAKASVLGEDNTLYLAGCWNDMVTDAGFRRAAYDVADNTWELLSGHGPYVDPIAGMFTDDGAIYWYSETLRKEGGAVFVSGHRVVVDTFGDFKLRAKQPEISPSDFGPSDGAGLGSDGRVYVAGGDRDCQPEFGACTMPPVMAWKPNKNTWIRPTVLPTARIRVAVTGDDSGRIWAIGGLRADASSLFSKVEVYRPSSDTWAKAANLPADRFAATAGSTPNGRIWVVQGFDKLGNPLSDGYVFTPN
jgi:Kelch motif